MSSIMREDWIEVELGDLGEIITGNTPSKANPIFYSNKDFPFYKPTDLNAGDNVCFSNDGLSEEGLKNSRIAPEGSILVTCIGATIGKTGLIKKSGAFNQQINCIISDINIDSKFLYFQVIGLEFQKKIKENASSTTLPILNKSKFSILGITLAPLPIQRAIVSKIEALFSDLDNGIANFKKAQEQLKIYRQAVLKKAFEGKLSELGKEGLKDDRIIDKDNKYKEILQSSNPKNPNSDNKGDNLPKGWKWVKFAEVVNNFDGKRRPLSSVVRKTFKGEYPYYGACEIIDYVKDFLFDGEYLLIGEDGANLLSKSKPLSFIAKGKFWVNNHAHIVQTKEIIDIKFLNYQFNSLHINEYVSGSAQPKLNQLNLNKIPICLPPTIEEQAQIVQEIESRLSVCDKMEQSLNESIIKAEALRQSILKKAFEGRLLSEAEVELCKAAADYEPASELLKKIKAEKLATLRQAQDAKKKKPIVKKKSKK